MVEGGYRDALVAAQSRVETLERELAERRRVDQDGALLAALERERARCVVDMEMPEVDRMLGLRLYLPAAGLALVSLFEGHWAFALLCVAVVLAARGGVRAFCRSNVDAARKQLALIETKIAEVERRAAP